MKKNTEIEIQFEKLLQEHVVLAELRDIYRIRFKIALKQFFDESYKKGLKGSAKIWGKNFGDLTPEQKIKLRGKFV